MPIYDYELRVYDELFKLDGSVKDKHLCWLKSRGLGGSWLTLRIMTFLALNELAGTNMAIVTGNRIELSVTLINTIKSWFGKHDFVFDTKETVIRFPNGTVITGFPAGHIDSMRDQSFYGWHRSIISLFYICYMPTE